MPYKSIKSVIFLLLVVFAAGCGDDDTVNPGPGAGQVPDFSLADVNPTSATADQSVSPRDYLTKVSAWYLGHST